METTLKITGNWNEMKTKLKQQYPNLNDTDLAFIPGKEEDLVNRLEKKLGKSYDEVCNLIDDLQSKRRETSETGKEKQDYNRTERTEETNKTERETEKESSKKY